MVLITAFLLIVAVLGGSPRGDCTALVVLYPLAWAMLAIGAPSLKTWPAAYFRHGLFAAALLTFVGVQLVPLPLAVWQALPGRGIVAQIDHAAGLTAVWRPLTLTPEATWGSFWFLAVPLAMLVLGTRLDEKQRIRLLDVWLIIGCVSGLIGLLQIALPELGSHLYWYKVTNHGAGVGLFANRNHQAILLDCMIPMLAELASRRGGKPRMLKMRRFTSVAGIILTVPMLLVTGSRSGFVLGIFAIACTPFLYQTPYSKTWRISFLGRLWSSERILTFSLAGVVGSVMLAASALRADAFSRLTDFGLANDTRWELLALTLASAADYLPLGAGTGSFAQVIQLHEPARLLSQAYFNQAHDELADLLLTGGVGGIALLVVALVGYATVVKRVWRLIRQKTLPTPDRFYRLGVVIVTIISLGSLADYPLRTPLMACLFVTATLWLPRSTQGVNGASNQTL